MESSDLTEEDRGDRQLSCSSIEMEEQYGRRRKDGRSSIVQI